MNFPTFRNNTLNLLNSLALVHRTSTPETWPAARDAVLKTFGDAVYESLRHLEYSEETTDGKGPDA